MAGNGRKLASLQMGHGSPVRQRSRTSFGQPVATPPRWLGQDSRRSRAMKYISLIAVAASALVVGCTVATSERVVERRAPAVSERTVVYTDPAPATTTLYTP